MRLSLTFQKKIWRMMLAVNTRAPMRPYQYAKYRYAQFTECKKKSRRRRKKKFGACGAPMRHFFTQISNVGAFDFLVGWTAPLLHCAYFSPRITKVRQRAYCCISAIWGRGGSRIDPPSPLDRAILFSQKRTTSPFLTPPFFW